MPKARVCDEVERRARQVYSVAKSGRNRNGKQAEWLFTFETWWSWWQIDDRWSNRGHGAGKFVMARKDRDGPWSLDNVYCGVGQVAQTALGDADVSVRLAFLSHRSAARRRGIEFQFTFAQWWSWWQIDDRWSHRGIGADKFVMARFNDVGPYHPDNVYCATNNENLRRDVSAEVRRVAAAKSYATRCSRFPDGAFVVMRIKTPYGVFGSLKEACVALGMMLRQVRYRVHKGLDGFERL